MKKFGAVFVSLLFMMLPIASALEISNVQATQITENSAVITWTTDEEADSFLYYGTEDLVNIGDAAMVTDHALAIDSLDSETEYKYKVESNELIDDNDGNLYSFTTLAPDTEAPDVNVEFPEFVSGNQLTLTGIAEPGSRVIVKVNGVVQGTVQAGVDGNFTVSGVTLSGEVKNEVVVEVEDAAGNKNSVTGEVYADTKKPSITIGAIPDLITENSVTVNGTISEEAEYEIFVNNKSVAKGTGTSFTKDVRLEEGQNKIVITATDKAGQQGERTFSLEADSKPPKIKAEIDKGLEYYEGRAESSIHGTSDPGAKLYLYVYRPLSYEFKPDFKKPRKVITADEKGEFVFEDVNFATTLTDVTLDDIVPREVPSGLLDTTIFPIRDVTGAEQDKTYYVYIIAEDNSGKSTGWDAKVRVVSCTSGSMDFNVEQLTQFQAPLRLIPQLMDDGRQEIQAVFQLKYHGSGSPKLDTAGNEIENAFRINSVRITPACTKSMRDDKRTGMACKILDRSPKVTKNHDQTSIYATWNLHATSEFSDREAEFWDDFQKRMLLFPLKITVSYQDRTEGQVPTGSNVIQRYPTTTSSPNTYGETKTQTACLDLGYYVDIPVDSKDMLPDFLANDLVSVINTTLTGINEVKPYLEKAFYIAGAACMGSMLGRLVARWARIFAAKGESYMAIPKKVVGAVSGEKKNKDEECPTTPQGQFDLYLEDTIKDLCELADKYDGDAGLPDDLKNVCNGGKPDEEAMKKVSLEKRCPKTAAAWKWEKGLDVVMKWSCDRSFCRKVPAGWTATESIEKIKTVIIEQSECGATGRGIPLTRKENCQQYFRNPNPLLNTGLVQNTQGTPAATTTTTANKNQVSAVCYETPNGMLYRLPEISEYSLTDQVTIREKREKGFFTLQPIGTVFGEFKRANIPLTVYKPEGSDSFITGRDIECNKLCGTGKNKVGTKELYSGKCFDERNVAGETKLFDPGSGKPLSEYAEKNQLVGKMYAAGYTKNCFIKGMSTSGTPIPAPTAVPAATPTPAATAAASPPTAVPATATTGAAPSAVSVASSVSSSGEVELQQCVCIGKKEGELQAYDNGNLRTAVPAKDHVAEPWSYRQERVFKESMNTKGTYYPKERYYTGRDVSGAFGADYLLDYFNSEGEKKVAKVDPHTQMLGTLQTVCLSGILKHMRMLESILQGMQGCLIEAKKTGLQDAGMCKTLFTQHVCGLIYKAIAYLGSSCTPVTFDDKQREGGLEDVTALFSRGLDSIGEAVDSSVNDMKDEYGNAQLNQFFKAGTQGLTQSICMAAMGVEFPLFSEEFLMDAAYAFPAKTTVMSMPKERELSTYNPATQTAIHNYNIGVGILAGCRIKRARVTLKCIGPEDDGMPGVDRTCGGKGCDCLNFQSSGAPYESQRSWPVHTSVNIPSGQWFSMPIKSPLKADPTNYRYDHVMIEVELDHTEKGNADKCFDEQYIRGNGAIFYEPIKDVSPPGELSCKVDLTSGRYHCPELRSLFGFGGAFFEKPFITCYNKQSGSWEDCTNTPNLFIMNDEIKVRAHLNLDDKGKCIKRFVRGLQGVNVESGTKMLPENHAGPIFKEDVIDVVKPEMFTGGGSSGRVVKATGSNTGCVEPTNVRFPSSAVSGGSFSFQFDNSHNLKLSGGVSPDNSNMYGTDGSGVLLEKTTNKNTFTVQEINQIRFNYQGYIIENVLGSFNTGESLKQCNYQISSTGTTTQSNNIKYFTVEYQILERDSGGGCTFPSVPVKATGGATKVSKRVRIQQKTVESAVDLHQDFINKRYEEVLNKARAILNRNDNSLDNAKAYYYLISTFVMLNDQQGSYNPRIKQMVEQFFGKAYDAGVTSTSEYKKMACYLCQIGTPLGVQCSGVKCMSGGSGSGSSGDSLCGKSNVKQGVSLPTDWTTHYSCMEPPSSSNSGLCKGYRDYVPTNLQNDWSKYGCPGTQKCCPK